MRNAADYFGLMAYLLVMHGGMPDDASLLAEEYPRGQAGRRAARLRVVGGGRTKRRARSEAGASAGRDEAAA